MTDEKKQITDLITGNLYGLYEFIGNQAGCQLFKGETADWVISKPSCWPNIIFNTRIGGPENPEAVNEVIQKIKHKEAPPFWIITPETEGSLELSLEKNGMMAVDLLPGMAVSLENFYNNFKAGNNEDLNITEVSDPGQMTEWIEIVNMVIFKGKKLDQGLFTGLTGNPSIHFYLGTIMGTPAATSMSFISHPSAGFYNIATLPEFRKKGFATAMTSHAMIEAFSKGCETGILHASAMGEPVYSRLGFKAYGVYKVFWMAGKEFRDY